MVGGIVTNYVEWVFLKSENEHVLKEETAIAREQDVITKESVAEIAGKIYAMLS